MYCHLRPRWGSPLIPNICIYVLTIAVISQHKGHLESIESITSTVGYCFITQTIESKAWPHVLFLVLVGWVWSKRISNCLGHMKFAHIERKLKNEWETWKWLIQNDVTISESIKKRREYWERSYCWLVFLI